MHTNLSILDTALRLIGGAIFGAICGVMGWGIGVLALIPIVTGLSGYCPLYDVLKIKTNEVSSIVDDHEGLPKAEVPSMPEYRQAS